MQEVVSVNDTNSSSGSRNSAQLVQQKNLWNFSGAFFQNSEQYVSRILIGTSS